MVIHPTLEQYTKGKLNAEQRRGRLPERLFLYWTEEEHKKDALMEISYRPELIEKTNLYLDTIIANIQAKQFAVVTPPEWKVCKACDMHSLCKKEGLI